MNIVDPISGVTTPPPPTKSAETAHVLDTTLRPAACSCGKAKYAGSPTFVRERHAVHIEDVALRSRPALTTGREAVDE